MWHYLLSRVFAAAVVPVILLLTAGALITSYSLVRAGRGAYDYFVFGTAEPDETPVSQTDKQRPFERKRYRARDCRREREGRR